MEENSSYVVKAVLQPNNSEKLEEIASSLVDSLKTDFPKEDFGYLSRIGIKAASKYDKDKLNFYVRKKGILGFARDIISIEQIFSRIDTPVGVTMGHFPHFNILDELYATEGVMKILEENYLFPESHSS